MRHSLDHHPVRHLNHVRSLAYLTIKNLTLADQFFAVTLTALENARILPSVSWVQPAQGAGTLPRRANNEGDS